MGHSCGGGSRFNSRRRTLASPGLGIWFSGAGWLAQRGNDAASLQKIQGPDPAHHRRRASTTSPLGAASRPSRRSRTRRFSTGGRTTFSTSAPSAPGTAATTALIARNWLEWTTRNDQNAAPDVQGRRLHVVQGPDLAHPEEADRRSAGHTRALVVAVGEEVRDVPVAGAGHRHVAARPTSSRYGRFAAKRRFQRRGQVVRRLDARRLHAERLRQQREVGVIGLAIRRA